jgi:hypothetical protein
MSRAFQECARVTRPIISKYGIDNPVLLMDATPGPGFYELKNDSNRWSGSTSQGSTFRLAEAYQMAGIGNYALIAPEPANDAFQELERNVQKSGDVRIHPLRETCEAAMEQRLRIAKPQIDVYGLIFWDYPKGIEIPAAALNRINKFYPRVDVLLYLPTTGYKRTGNGNYIPYSLDTIGKRYIAIREPETRTGWRWVFYFLTNWKQHPLLDLRMWARLDSPEGQAWQDMATRTNEERKRRDEAGEE